MRRDVLRVGLGRAAFELALGVVLVLARTDERRAACLALACTAAFIAFATRDRRTSPRGGFLAAHVGMFGVALAAVLAPHAAWLTLPCIATALGASIELLHQDLSKRLKANERLDTLRWPRSVVLRRVGTIIVASAGARAMLGLEQYATLASHGSVASLFVAIGACAILTGGFAVGPGRPHTRPIDALIFVGLGLALGLAPLP